MKKMIFSFLLLSSFSMLAMEQAQGDDNNQVSSPLITISHTQGGDRFEHVTGALKYNLDTKSYYLGNTKIPRVCLFDVLCCADCCHMHSKRVCYEPSYSNTLEEREPKYYNKFAHYSVLCCSSVLKTIIGGVISVIAECDDIASS